LDIDFAEVTKPLIGLPIGHAWKGYGSAIFLEVGKLRPTGRNNRPTGEFCIGIEWNWRVEFGSTVEFGSSNTGAEINRRISSIEGAAVVSLETFGTIPELLIGLSTGHRIRTTVMTTGDPEWSIRIDEDKWIYVTDGKVDRSRNGIANTTPEELAEFELAKKTATRWSVPVVEPKNGHCSNCRSFVYLDGEGHLFDYGVCIAESSPFDGKVVNVRSGCPAFQPSDGT
jgi:hypothetical protein